MTRTVLPDTIKEQMKTVTHFELLFTDVLGREKSMSITEQEIWEIIKEGQGFDGSSIQGFVRLHESDLMADVRFRSFRKLRHHSVVTDMKSVSSSVISKPRTESRSKAIHDSA